MVKIEPENIRTLEDLLDVPMKAPKDAKHYMLRDLIRYCEERGIGTEDVTDEELKQFEILS